MPETVAGYQQSSEGGRERHIRVPWSRQLDTTPVLHDPVAITSVIVGSEVTGTIITVGTVADPVSIVNVAEGAKYVRLVRNVRTWAGGPAEATWGPINFGDPVFYDAESSAANGVRLSTSPQTSGAVANPRFGTVVMHETEAEDDFPKGDDQAGSNQTVTVMQCGLNQ